jgi:hypothetical protein
VEPGAAGLSFGAARHPVLAASEALGAQPRQASLSQNTIEAQEPSLTESRGSVVKLTDATVRKRAEEIFDRERQPSERWDEASIRNRGVRDHVLEENARTIYLMRAMRMLQKESKTQVRLLANAPETAAIDRGGVTSRERT